MQNIRKTIRSIDMKKIKKYVVFKYEDEFGFHYMVMDKLPGERPTYIHGAHLVRDEGRASQGGTYTSGDPLVQGKDQPKLYSWSYHSSAVFGGRQIGWVGGQIMKTFWNGGKGPGLTEPPRRRRGKGGEIPSSRKSLSLHEKQTIASAQAECGGDLLL